MTIGYHVQVIPQYGGYHLNWISEYREAVEEGGRKGWELVSAFPDPKYYGTMILTWKIGVTS